MTGAPWDRRLSRMPFCSCAPVRREKIRALRPTGVILSFHDMTASINYQSLAEFRYQIRRFLTFSEREARAAGIEPQQHQLLLAIKGLPKGQRPTIGTLAERLQLRHHSAVELVNRLVERRLATRRRSEADGREVLIHVTARGEQLLRRLSLAHKDELRSMGPSLVRALESIITEPVTTGKGAQAESLQ
jgi:DNA-binding MarR family transcriptional regulator